MESSAEQKAIRIRVTPFRGLSFLLWRILALHFAVTYTLYYSFYVFSVYHTWLWVWEEKWKIHSNWTLWVWQCKLDFVNWISCFSLFFSNFYLVKEKFSKHLFLIQRAVRIMQLNFFSHDGGKSVPAYFMCSQQILLHQCYAFQLQILPYTCQNILTTQLNKHTLQVLKNEVNLWCACVNVPKQHVWSRLRKTALLSFSLQVWNLIDLKIILPNLLHLAFQSLSDIWCHQCKNNFYSLAIFVLWETSKLCKPYK